MAEPDGLPEHLLAKLRIKIPGYELLGKIASGGQATVYRARELTSGLTVAVKLLHGGPLADEGARLRLLRETASLKALNHPNIVCEIESGRTPIGLDYLVMNYVDGRPLDAIWNDPAFAAAVAPEPPARLQLFKHICNIVQAAHFKGITHRDLSPSNILIDSVGEAHLLDFGLASTAFNKMLNPAGTSVSLSGQFLGKLQYAAPEQVTGARDAVDSRTDVYALGVMLYQILTNGILPYEVGDNLADAIKNIVSTRPLPPSTILAAHGMARRSPTVNKGPTLLNPTIEAIVLKALEKQRTDRYQSAGELAADIEQYLAGRSTLAEAKLAAPKVAGFSFTKSKALVAVAVLATLLALQHQFRGRAVHILSSAGAVTDETGSTKNTGVNVIPAGRPGRVVDLLALLDVDHDALRGTWKRVGREVSVFDNWYANMRLPYQPPFDYDVLTEFTLRNPGEVTLLLRAGSLPFRIGCRCIDGKWKTIFLGWRDPNRVIVDPEPINDSRRHVYSINVRKDQVCMFLDRKMLIKTVVNPAQLEAIDTGSQVGDQCLGFGACGETTFHRFDLTELNGETGLKLDMPPIGVPFDLGRQARVETPARVVDLMPYIDPQTDALAGRWARTVRGLELVDSGVSHPPGQSLLRIRYQPPAEYDLRVTFERTGAGANGDLELYCPLGQKGGACFYPSTDFNTLCGFAGFDGLVHVENLRTGFHQVGILRSNKRYTAVVRVRNASIGRLEASINGRVVAECLTDPEKVAAPEVSLPIFNDRCLGLGSWHTETIFHEIQLAEITGEGHPLRAGAQAISWTHIQTDLPSPTIQCLLNQRRIRVVSRTSGEAATFEQTTGKLVDHCADQLSATRYSPASDQMFSGGKINASQRLGFGSRRCRGQ